MPIGPSAEARVSIFFFFFLLCRLPGDHCPLFSLKVCCRRGQPPRQPLVNWAKSIGPERQAMTNSACHCRCAPSIFSTKFIFLACRNTTACYYTFELKCMYYLSICLVWVHVERGAWIDKDRTIAMQMPLSPKAEPQPFYFFGVYLYAVATIFNDICAALLSALAGAIMRCLISLPPFFARSPTVVWSTGSNTQTESWVMVIINLSIAIKSGPQSGMPATRSISALASKQ